MHPRKSPPHGQVALEKVRYKSVHTMSIRPKRRNHLPKQTPEREQEIQPRRRNTFRDTRRHTETQSQDISSEKLIAGKEGGPLPNKKTPTAAGKWSSRDGNRQFREKRSRSPQEDESQDKQGNRKNIHGEKVSVAHPTEEVTTQPLKGAWHTTAKNATEKEKEEEMEY